MTVTIATSIFSSTDPISGSNCTTVLFGLVVPWSVDVYIYGTPAFGGNHLGRDRVDQEALDIVLFVICDLLIFAPLAAASVGNSILGPYAI